MVLKLERTTTLGEPTTSAIAALNPVTPIPPALLAAGGTRHEYPGNLQQDADTQSQKKPTTPRRPAGTGRTNLHSAPGAVQRRNFRPIKPRPLCVPNARKGWRPIGRYESRDSSGVSRCLLTLAKFHPPLSFLLPVPGFPPLPLTADRVLFRVAALVSPGRFFLRLLLPQPPLGSLAPTPSRRPDPNPTQGNKPGEGRSEASPGRGLSRVEGRPEAEAEAEEPAAPERPGRRPQCREPRPPLPPTLGPERRRRGRGLRAAAANVAKAGEPVGWGLGRGRLLKGDRGRFRRSLLRVRGPGPAGVRSASLEADV